MGGKFGWRRWAGLVPALIVLAGCVISTTQRVPVTASNRALTYNGFALSAPTEGGWMIVAPARPPFATTLVKPGGSPTQVIEATVSILHRPKLPSQRLFEELEKAKRAETAAARFSSVVFTVSMLEYRETECERYDATMEDRGVPHDEGRLYLFEVHGAACLHPGLQSEVIDVQYSRRRLISDRPVAIAPEGEAFLKSLEFIPMVRPYVSNSIEVNGSPQLVAAGHGSLWVTRMSDNVVARITPEMELVAATIPVGNGPVGLAVTETAVWVANTQSGTVSRIDPASNEVTATIKVGADPLMVTAAFGSVWVTNSGDETLSRIDPETNRATAAVVGRRPSGVVAAGDSLWVASLSENTVQRIDPVSGRPDGSPIEVGRGPNFLAGDHEAVWATNQLDGTLSRIDVATRMVTATVRIGSSLGGLALGHGFVWVADFQRGVLVRIDPRSGARLDHPTPVGARPLGVTVTTDAVLVVDRDGGSLMRIEP